jgi:hypothetical protein
MKRGHAALWGIQILKITFKRRHNFKSDFALPPTSDIAQQCANKAKNLLRIVARYP